MFVISDIGNNYTEFYSHSGLILAKGYKRIVYGNRGPYIEFEDKYIKFDNIYIPNNANWRLNSNKSFYIEYRSKCESFVKIYFQKKLVSYANYKIGKYYISPYELKNIVKEEYNRYIINKLFK